MMMQRKQVLTLEEYRRRPPLTPEDRGKHARARRQVMEEVDAELWRFLAAGGKTPTPEEWQETWDYLHYADQDDC